MRVCVRLSCRLAAACSTVEIERGERVAVVDVLLFESWRYDANAAGVVCVRCVKCICLTSLWVEYSKNVAFVMLVCK